MTINEHTTITVDQVRQTVATLRLLEQNLERMIGKLAEGTEGHTSLNDKREKAQSLRLWLDMIA